MKGLSSHLFIPYMIMKFPSSKLCSKVGRVLILAIVFMLISKLLKQDDSWLALFIQGLVVGVALLIFDWLDKKHEERN